MDSAIFSTSVYFIYFPSKYVWLLVLFTYVPLVFISSIKLYAKELAPKSSCYIWAIGHISEFYWWIQRNHKLEYYTNICWLIYYCKPFSVNKRSPHLTVVASGYYEVAVLEYGFHGFFKIQRSENWCVFWRLHLFLITLRHLNK